jgi:hypothetical protein
MYLLICLPSDSLFSDPWLPANELSTDTPLSDFRSRPSVDGGDCSEPLSDKASASLITLVKSIPELASRNKIQGIS